MRSKIIYVKECFLAHGLKGLSNLAAAYFSLKFKPKKAAFPILLLIEPTVRCQLSCKMCVRSRQVDRKEGDLKFKDYIHILNQFDAVSNLCLSGLGEPFMNPEIFEMIRYAKKVKKISYVWLASNGQKLNAEICKQILNSGLDSIYLSIDAATPELYEAIRRGASYDRLIGNIASLVEINKKNGNRLNIKLDITVMSDNCNEIIKILDLAEKLKVNNVLISRVNADFARDKKLDDFNVNQDNLNSLAKKKGILLEYSDYLGCFEPWTRPYVTWDGFITPCAVRPDPSELNFGNLLEKHFRTIWNNTKFQEFRASLNKPLLCRDCPRIWK